MTWARHKSAAAVALLLLVAPAMHGQKRTAPPKAPSCAHCHAAVATNTGGSLHKKMFEPATASTVVGDFSVHNLQLRASTYGLERRDGSYFITESYLSGKPWQHRVEYTLGERRYQQYLTTLPDGSIVVLQPAWDRARKTWVHSLDVHNPEQTGRDEVQVWNNSCYSCHVSGGKKNFDLAQMRYRTQWAEMGVACERCHGESKEHASAAARAGSTRAALGAAIVNPSRLAPARSTIVCAQCHSFRDTYVDGFEPGADYYDYFAPIMEYRRPNSEDPAFWADGRPRWISNEAVALWQSQCFLKGGATCVTCHTDPHRVDVARNSQLRSGNNALCTRCHAKMAANVTAHTHHPANSAGSSCVECHMPRVVVGLNAHMRDHAISIPVPENTTRHGIPNACNECHQDRDANWAAKQMDAWYGSGSRQKLIARADAFAQARRGDTAAAAGLEPILADASAGPWIRANAAGYLGRFSTDPSANAGVLHALTDREPLVRATAALAISPRAAERAVAAPAVAALLNDRSATVRINAAIALAAMGVARQLPEEFRAPFQAAKDLYARRAAVYADDAVQQFAAGNFFLLAGDADAAAAAFRAALKLNPRLPVRYDLARALAEKGDKDGARSVLQQVAANDPQYAAAQQLLATLNEPGRDTAKPESAADALFQQGVQSYQEKNYGAALKDLDDALRAAPQASWSTKAQIYRAICLAKVSRTADAETAMQALPVTQETRRDVDLQLTWVELLYDTGRTDEALKRTDNLVAAVPESPAAYLWRARLLFQAQRVNEAAAAAEQSVRLLADQPEAHNLLLRIYQSQGRTREAAEQAEWLREYQRRTQSH